MGVEKGRDFFRRRHGLGISASSAYQGTADVCDREDPFKQPAALVVGRVKEAVEGTLPEDLRKEPGDEGVARADRVNEIYQVAGVFDQVRPVVGNGPVGVASDDH